MHTLLKKQTKLRKLNIARLRTSPELSDWFIQLRVLTFVNLLKSQLKSVCFVQPQLSLQSQFPFVNNYDKPSCQICGRSNNDTSKGESPVTQYLQWHSPCGDEVEVNGWITKTRTYPQETDVRFFKMESHLHFLAWIKVWFLHSKKNMFLMCLSIQSMMAMSYGFSLSYKSMRHIVLGPLMW